jgi:hypothetical protein
MKVEIFTFCDAAADYGERFSIMGAYDRLFSPTAPCVIERAAIVVRIRFQQSEQGTHHVTVVLIDEDGKVLGKFIDDHIPVAVPPRPNALRIGFVVNINNLMLPKLGEYRADLVVDGHQIGQIPLYLDKR